MDSRQNLIDRLNIKFSTDGNVEKQIAAFVLCRKDILSFFKYFLWTYDPRKTPSEVPFIPWDYQEKFIETLSDDIKNGTSQLTEKSRDMGVTWMILGTFLYRWLFHGESFLVGSRKEDLVDTIGNMDSHFERMRFMLDRIPSWMLKLCNFDIINSSYMKLYKSDGSSIVGESMNKGFSRQGRYKAILLDEFAFVDNAITIWRACGDSSPCKLPVSTPNGSNNFFAQLRKSGKIKINTLHWKLHPNKDAAWYQAQCENRSDKDVAQELDINYTISTGEPFYRGFSRGLHYRKMMLNKNKELILGWDYGFHHPNCSVHQITAEGIWIIVDNVFGENQTIDEFADYVSHYLQKNYEGYVYNKKGYGDPAGKQVNDKSKMSSEQILNKCGFYVSSVPSNSARSNYSARKAIIEKRLRTLINGIPSLVVNDVPNNLIIVEGFEGGYRYPDANKYGGVAESPAPDNWFEHPFNSLEYVAVNMFSAVQDINKVNPVNVGYRKPELQTAKNGDNI